MELHSRQQDILVAAVAEYIATAQPVSSQCLQEEYDFDISQATIRSELQELSELGYLVQPHTSAGRVPTDKGYRFFVDGLRGKKKAKPFAGIHAKEQDNLVVLQELAKQMSSLTSLLAFVHVENILWKEGWEEVLQEPEFQESMVLRNFTHFVEDIEENMENFSASEQVQIYIGRENPFSKIQDFSIMVADYALAPRKKCTVTLLGPKRMAYDKNIRLLDSLL
jgi:heat-inducible transcriptional repressor